MLVQLYKGSINNYGFGGLRLWIAWHAQDVIPDLKFSPFEKAFMYGFPRSERWMQVPVPPGRSCFHDPQDGVKYQAVLLTLPASGFSAGLCQHRPDYVPIFV